MADRKQILNATEFHEAVHRLTMEAAALACGPAEMALIGIRTHGVSLARRMADILAQERGWDVPLGVLDITLYRDDLHQLAPQPIVRPTHIDFNITGRLVVLVDDVVYTGRTVRCALDQIMEVGRPRAVRLATLVDRGLRELPIQPDLVGLRTETTHVQQVEVQFEQSDGVDGAWICEPGGETT